jgi:transcriptional regulator with XRE-family HTH domain
MNFERIIFIRESLDLSQRELAEKLHVSKSTYARWETGEKIIPLEHLIDLCNLAKESIDYALSLSDKRKNLTITYKIDNEKIGTKLKELRILNNYSQKQMAELLNTSQSVVSNYETGNTLIQTAFLFDICNKFNVSAHNIIK